MAVPRLDEFALVTGAASGIGKETGFVFAEAGSAGVVFADIDYHGAKTAVEESKKYAVNAKFQAIAIKVDVTNSTSVQEMVDAAVRAFGRIDYSVNAAGVSNAPTKAVSQLDLASLDTILNVNLRGTIYCIAAVAKVMVGQEARIYVSKTPRAQRNAPRSLGRGEIVNLGSVNSVSTQYGTLPYTASKHGVLGVTRAAAIDHVRDGIRVNAVCPGIVDTPMMQRAIERAPRLGSVIQKFSPIEGRMAYTEEVAEFIGFLCGPGATYTTGAAIVIDASVSIAPPRL